VGSQISTVQATGNRGFAESFANKERDKLIAGNVFYIPSIRLLYPEKFPISDRPGDKSNGLMLLDLNDTPI